MRRHLTPRLLFSLLCVFLAFLIPLSLYIGVVKIPLSSLFSSEIIIEMRAPRITMAFLVGSSLAVAGAVVQGVFRNPLAEPYLLGISSGAILGYSLSFFFREELAIPLAFLFSTFPISLIILASTSKEKTILLGISISFLTSSMASLLMYLSGERLYKIFLWIMGCFHFSTWKQVLFFFQVCSSYFLLVSLFYRELNSLQFGDEYAEQTGVDPTKYRKVFLLSSSFLVSVSVLFSGVIGFVGLVVPHLVRLLTGRGNYKYLIPNSILLGGILTLLADDLSRLVLAPREIPVGIVTSITGSPILIYLLWRESKWHF